MKQLLYLFTLSVIFSCGNNVPPEVAKIENPASPGFDTINSDKVAMALADSVMVAQGGRKAWDESRYFTWNFFGSRKHWWDKKTGDIRIESFRTDLKIIMNLNTMQGKVFINGMEQTATDSLSKYLEVGKEMWINDSYWLFMPFKLKDSGVTLKYLGTEPMQNGKIAEVLQLTFSGVGVTPQNMYRVYINPENYLIEQWAYYKTARQDTADIITPWTGYNTYGRLKFSGFRGEKEGKVREITEITVQDTMNADIFKKL